MKLFITYDSNTKIQKEFNKLLNLAENSLKNKISRYLFFVKLL